MKETTEYQEVTTNRNYKSTLFVRLFEKKKDLLSLYNALNHTDYQNEDDLEINTIEGNLYMNAKNDVSILLDSTMNLYEHQSTLNPNMPLRGFLYFAQLYNKYIKWWKINIYSTKQQKIPLPQYVVFYNGTKEQPDEKILKLSDAFQMSKSEAKGCLECEARMLNINYGHNQELMEQCQRLREYSIFIDRVRTYAPKFPERLDIAITKAIDRCISEGILKDFLEERRSEVLELIFNEFDKELYEKEMKQDAFEEGREAGLVEGHEAGLAEGHEAGLAEGLIKMARRYHASDDEILTQLMEEFHIEEEKAKEYLTKK